MTNEEWRSYLKKINEDLCKNVYDENDESFTLENLWKQCKPASKSIQSDPVDHPAHYTDGGIETIDFIRAKLTPEEFVGYCKGNAIKYVSRAGKKGDFKEDLQKACKYLEWAVE